MQISKQKVDCLAIRSHEINTLTKNNDTTVENFPRCFLRVYEKLSPPCRLQIKGLHVSGQEYSDFDLASSTTASSNKYQGSDDGQQDTHVDIISMFYIYIKCVKSVQFYCLIPYLYHLSLQSIAMCRLANNVFSQQIQLIIVVLIMVASSTGHGIILL